MNCTYAPSLQISLVPRSQTVEGSRYSLQHLLLLLEFLIVTLCNICESPLLRNNDLLSSGELVTSAAKSFHNNRCVGVLATNGKDDLANVDTCNGSVWLAPSSTHTSLQSITKSISRTGNSDEGRSHRSAPAQLNILLILMTWNGCTLTRMWKESLPEVLVTYLLAQIRAASSASDDSCSYSSETKWQQKGNSSTEARFLPRSKMRIYKKLGM